MEWKDRLEFFREFVRTILGLSGGAIVLSITLLQALRDRSSTMPLAGSAFLLVSWAAFLVAMLASLVYLYFLTLITKDSGGEKYPHVFKVSSAVLLIAFLLGLASFVWFGWSNVA